MPLPVYTSVKDIEEIVSYLQRKPVGATLSDARSTVGNLLESRKLNAYVAWGFVQQESGKIRLTQQGQEFSRASEEQRKEIFSQVIREIPPYSRVMEWIHYQKLDNVPIADIGRYWYENFRDQIGSANERKIRDQVSCFANIVKAAGLGEYRIGRRGQQTRFEIDRMALGHFINETVPIDHAISERGDEEEDVDENYLDEEYYEEDEAAISSRENEVANSGQVPEPTRVFISHSKNMDIVEQIKDLVDNVELEYEVAVEEETAAIPVPEKVFSAMRRCNAAVICVTADEQSMTENNDFMINNNVLIEIGAAFVLYDRRVALVWDRRLQVLSNLQGLYRCEFEGNELSWREGMKLQRTVKGFKTTN